MVEKSANIRHDHVLYPVFLDRKKFVSSLTLNKSKMADSGNAARKRDLDQNHFILHGCRCTELKSNNNSFHIHCPCDICSGKARVFLGLQKVAGLMTILLLGSLID